ncbi:DUF1254 domain-containing protein [Paraburkholderia domus]|nr:DUF1254 domain-containing protein [Paraburkholderia domus]MBK5049377.1 DUF1254 domain-containing protein [Burkholderia sp. R-70006]MBK5062060.1 DUF1254 domain-containing protein [Burkholderia sp. R-70199]MBK5087314.1 DUF1254 domain-containing protein [Burkholderia sp. R-69927]MBK5124239.1 DUF1254 domain-containing protein [Burkholderia sp. R-69980]MBK5166901.1 DUF1254 domain-containing protein [Burkholderia sp. R-70211]MBK5180752.1 DUF1254 domain-containing protein [Burkholderia sp. R-6974
MLAAMPVVASLFLILSAINARAENVDPHGWAETGPVATRYGNFEFSGGYPTADTERKLEDVLVLNRAVETYLTQMPAVSWYRVWKGVEEADKATPNQMVVWERLMNAQTLLLTGNTETVYAMSALDLKRDGPTVIEAPPMLLGGASDLWQNELIGIGPTGADKGKGGKFLFLPPDYTGTVPKGYIVARSPTYKVVFGVRGFLVDGKPDKAVALMKSTKIYPLAQVSKPPAMTFVDGSTSPVDTIFADNYQYFDDLENIIATEPAGIISSTDRFTLASIGIAHGTPFTPDANRKALLDEAAHLGGAIARENTFASKDPARLVYPDRRWELLFVGGSATWDSQGYLNTDRRAGFAYAAIGMSPAMVDKVVGAGSQYIWTPRDANGAYLDGARSYRLRLPPGIPVKNFWSVVVYDAQSRSMLQNGEKFPSISQYTTPVINADGSVDIYFGPAAPKDQHVNWIKTVPGKGWFPIIRFYGPLQAFFDKTWKPDDIVPL